MVESWDRVRLATLGDENDAVTFEWVGRVLSAWETVEFSLALGYCDLVGDLVSRSSISIYGSGGIFRERLIILQNAASAFFLQHPCQETEGLFVALCKHLVGYSARRNDVAHGIVYQIAQLSHFRDRMPDDMKAIPQWALVPPVHTERFHEDGLPLYAYASDELFILCGHLYALHDEVKDVRKAIKRLRERRGS